MQSDPANYTISLTLDGSAEAIFAAINNVRGWWSENIIGETDQAGSEFLYYYKDVHRCRIRIAELVPAEKVVWEVLENSFSFVPGDTEWVGNRLVFEISSDGPSCRLQFTQEGLTPADACYDVCNDAWNGFFGNSLRKLIVTGTGEPTPKDREGAFNEAIIRKWSIGQAGSSDDFSFGFRTGKSPEAVFSQLRDIESWWSGLFGESIEGSSDKMDDEFSFRAGNGVHFSKQRLTAFTPGRSIGWKVIDSNLKGFRNSAEWTGTSFGFELRPDGDGTELRFTHTGLAPAIECYDNCSMAWTQYMEKLRSRLEE